MAILVALTVAGFICFFSSAGISLSLLSVNNVYC